MIPAFEELQRVAEPGWTTTATVSATSATSVSDCPTPTVSMTTTSKAAARAVTAARVAEPDRRDASPAAVERMNTPRSAGSTSIRARSPRRAPPGAPGGGVDGQHGHGAALAAPRRHEPREQRGLADARRSRDTDHVGRCLAAQRGRGDACQQRRRSARARGQCGSRPGTAPREPRSGRGRAGAARVWRPSSFEAVKRPSSGEDPVALGDQRDDVAHHLVQVPVLGGVDGGDARFAQGRRRRRRE